MVKAVRMQRATGNAIDWESTWTSLTFDIPRAPSESSR
jgi:hypothetical protein